MKPGLLGGLLGCLCKLGVLSSELSGFCKRDIDIGTSIGIDMNIDSGMAIALNWGGPLKENYVAETINWGSLKGSYRASLKGIR